jgi:dTDP-4-amino-4,6-dideoxygalactose transaminase
MDRERVRLALEHLDIEARPVWKPMHLQPVFAGYEALGGAVSETLFRNGLCLPSGSSLTSSDLMRVVEGIRELANEPDGVERATAQLVHGGIA